MSVSLRRSPVVAGMALAVAFAFDGSRGSYESTEGRYAESAREMVATGRFAWSVITAPG